jgi:hypothetical protein
MSYEHVFKLWREEPELIDSGIVGAAYTLASSAPGHSLGIGGAIEAVVALADFLREAGFWETWEANESDAKVWASYRRGKSVAERVRRGDLALDRLKQITR